MTSRNPTAAKPRLRVAFLLANRFTLSAFASFVDVLRLSADEGDRSRQIQCKWDVLAARQQPIVSSCGISVFPNKSLIKPESYDYIVLVGGILDDTGRALPDYLGFLQDAAAKHIPIVGLCTASFILHQAGLMEGYRCCVSWYHHQDFIYSFEGSEPVSDQIFVVDRDRLTCSGGTSSAHLAAYLVEKHIGLAQARKSLRILIMNDMHEEIRTQPGIPVELKTRDPLVTRCLTLMQQKISAPISVRKMSAILETDRRTIERHFQTVLNTTPALANKLIRLNYAKKLLATTDSSIAYVADETGFCNPSHFVKAFKDQEGITPSAYRHHHKNQDYRNTGSNNVNPGNE